MGRSGNWIKSLISLKKNQSNDTEKSVGKGRKWKLWRSASGGIAMTSSKSVKGVGNFGDSEGSEASFLSDNGFAAAMAAVVRAPHKDFIIVKQEWAALRIQAMFRAFLARRALRALKAVVRLQAIVRGRLVRKQAAMTLKCMQALVRVQARVRAQCNQTSLEENALNSDPIKSGWCDSPGTVDEVRSKFKMRQLGAIKRERAIAYAQQRNPSPKTQNKGRSNGDGSWLERWMAYKPWEDHTERSSVSIRRNNVSTRISAREPISCRIEYPYDDSTSSYSSTVSNSEEGQSKKPNYMNPTESIKAKKVQQRNTNYSNQSMQRHSTDSLQIHRKSSPVSRAIARRSAECDLYSVDLC